MNRLIEADLLRADLDQPREEVLRVIDLLGEVGVDSTQYSCGVKLRISALAFPRRAAAPRSARGRRSCLPVDFHSSGETW